jgi:hypothetical protein
MTACPPKDGTYVVAEASILGDLPDKNIPALPSLAAKASRWLAAKSASERQSWHYGEQCGINLRRTFRGPDDSGRFALCETRSEFPK